MSTEDASVFTGILDSVRAQLRSPRVLSVRVGGAVCSMLNVDDPLDGLALDLLTAREPFEVEWLLSSLFTPTYREREACEAVLPLEGIAEGVIETLVTALSAEKLFCLVSFGHREQQVPVLPVVIERYVRLLHLNAGVHPLLLPLLRTWESVAERLSLTSLARRSVWQTESRAHLLRSALQAMGERGSFRVEKVRFLTDFVGSYRPSDETHLLRALANLVEAYHQDNAHPVYNQQLEHYQGENIRSRYCDSEVKAFRLSMAHALLTDFGYSPPLVLVE
ncbi:MAG: hypothetical protein H7836_15920 [Magnetococcus sp. YQC-3]